jgi:type I restriction enzyme S subunit
MLEPKKRFSEFKDPLQQSRLGDIAIFLKGKGISKNDIVINGINECIRYGELYTTYGELISKVSSKTNISKSDSILSEINDIIIPSSGESQLDIAKASCVLVSGVILGGDLNIIRMRANGVFFSYYLNSAKKIEIAKIAQGNSVVHLYSRQLSNLIVNYPSPPEQQKIASFLSTVDEKINLLKKQLFLLEQYKKGVMQKIFSREIRFKDENGNEFPEWELITLGECLDYEQPNNYLVDNTEYSDTYPTPVVTAGKTFILGYTNEKNGIFANNLPVIIFDDFTTSSQFVTFPFKAKSSAMKILKAKPLCSVKFLFEALQMIKYEVGGHGRHWISVFSKLEILIPNHLEQQKIASFLSSFDEKIDKTQDQIRKMELWKKGLLQQMFC